MKKEKEIKIMDYKPGNIINHKEFGYSKIEKIENGEYHLLLNFSMRDIEKDESKIEPIFFDDVLEKLGFRVFEIQGGYGFDTSHFVDYYAIINGERVLVSRFFNEEKFCAASIIRNGCNTRLNGNYYLHDIQNSFFELTGKQFDCMDMGCLLKEPYFENKNILIPPDAYNLEVFAIQDMPEGAPGKQAFVGFKISNGNFNFVQIPYTGKEIK